MHAAISAEEDLADVNRVLAGEVQAFEGIVRRWQGPLVNMAWRYCRDRGRAEEMAQEAFLRAWRGLAGWRRESSFSTWLFALAANVFRSQHEGLARKQSDETIRRAVLALPTRYREPVVLYYFHEMDVAAASRTMGLPEGTLKARLVRGRELLRKRFPQLNDEQSTPLLSSTLQPKKEVLQ